MELESSFERDLQEAVLDNAEHELVGKQNNLVFQAVQCAHDILREYGDEFGYDVEPIIESLGQVEVNRTANGLTIRWGWTHEAAPYLSFGTPDHSVTADDGVLAFEWPDAPLEVQKEFSETFPTVFFKEVEVQGVEETRFVRRGLRWLEQEIKE